MHKSILFEGVTAPEKFYTIKMKLELKELVELKRMTQNKINNLSYIRERKGKSTHTKKEKKQEILNEVIFYKSIRTKIDNEIKIKEGYYKKGLHKYDTGGYM